MDGTMGQKSSTMINLGERIRSLRIEQELKLIDVSNKTGLSSSFLSQVERSLVSPSIDALKKIGDALSTPLSFFFETKESKDISSVTVKRGDQNKAETISAIPESLKRNPVVHEDTRKILSPEPGVTFYLLNPDMSGPIEFIYNIYESGASTGEGLYSHEGYECGLILEGELLITMASESYLLKKGDSITFSSAIPHSKKNTGETQCVCVWANTPPYF
jgi:transcriptional regulator with XRE-family HTH domain